MMLRKPVLAAGVALSVFALVAAGAATFSVSNATGTPGRISPVMSGNVSYDIQGCTDSFTVDWDANTGQTAITKITVQDTTTTPTCTGTTETPLTLTETKLIGTNGAEAGEEYIEIGLVENGAGVAVGDWVKVDAVDDTWDDIYQVAEAQSYGEEGSSLVVRNDSGRAGVSELVSVAVVSGYQMTVDTYSVDGTAETRIPALSQAASPLTGSTVVIAPTAAVDITAYKSLKVVVTVQHS